jgi:SOS-response transcriptional repressor LexA
MDEIIFKIKKEIEKQGISETRAAKMAGVKQDTVNRLLKGGTKKPDLSVIQKLQAALGISESNAHSAKLVPVYGTVPAGWPDEHIDHVAEEEVIDWIPVEGSSHGVGALLVEGHSMSPEIRDGAYVLYIKDYNIKPGDIIVATDEYNRAMVKQYAVKDGEPWLISINPEYPGFKVNDSYRIVGRVFQKYEKTRVGRGR